MEFSNKTVLITGASRGIGRATAIEFAKRGANIVVNYFSNDEQAISLLDRLNTIGVKAISIKCDVSDSTQVKNMVTKVVNTFGKIDILVNNAAIVFDSSFLDCTVEEWKRTFDVNLLGTVLCSKTCLPYFPKTGGAIVNLSSTSGLDIFSPESMAYDATKIGITTITKSLAKEFSTYGIRVNAVAPGWVDTDMNKNLPKEVITEAIEKIYLKRIASPVEIAQTILFLAGEQSSFVNGTTLVVDGGYG